MQGADLQRKSTALEAHVDFAVSVNSDRLALACGATDLQNREDGSDRINLKRSAGCGISLDNATPVTSDVSGYLSADADGDLVFDKTGYLQFRANDGGRTSRARLHVEWELENRNQDKQFFSGHVKLYAMLPVLEV